jgi:hypothetical protein
MGTVLNCVQLKTCSILQFNTVPISRSRSRALGRVKSRNSTQSPFRVRTLPPIAILAIAWVGFVIYAHPGYLSYDSVGLLVEARARTYSDLAAPPVFAWLWHKIDWAIPGPFGMLVLQGTAFLAGTYGLCKRWLTPRTAAVVALGVLWFPPVLATLGVIWPESLATGLLMLGASWMLSETRTTKLAGLGVLVVASATREHGAAIALPIVVLLFVWQPAQRVIVRYAIAAGCWLAILVLAIAANAVLLDKRVAASNKALVDITGTLRYAELSDAEMREAVRGIPLELKSIHTYELTGLAFQTRPATAADRELIQDVRDELTSDHRGAYLRHRVTMFRRAMRWDVENSGAYVWFNDVGNLSASAGLIAHDARPSTIQRGLQAAMLWLGETPVFAPWLYLAGLLALVPLVRRDRELLALVASGLMTAAVAFVYAYTDELRGSLWLVVTSVLVTIVALVRLANARRR